MGLSIGASERCLVGTHFARWRHSRCDSLVCRDTMAERSLCSSGGSALPSNTFGSSTRPSPLDATWSRLAECRLRLLRRLLGDWIHLLLRAWSMWAFCAVLLARDRHFSTKPPDSISGVGAMARSITTRFATEYVGIDSSFSAVKLAKEMVRASPKHKARCPRRRA